MKKILAYPLTIIYYLLFGLTLVIFHPIQWISLRVFGYQAHKKSVDILNLFILRCLNVLGTRFCFENPHHIPLDQPCIIVANHQGTYDIPPIIWYLRHLHPKFISKKELGKGIPSISFNLRHGGSVLIDRKDKTQALQAIKGLTEYLNSHHRSVVIIAEGTRSKDGVPIRFATAGLKTLFETMPTALIVPITINNSWKLNRWGGFPMDIGVFVKHKVHAPFFVHSAPVDMLISQVESVILQDFLEIRSRRK
jgi:1-acyl-sn-glycerol-3-phosphate acyltransferase